MNNAILMADKAKSTQSHNSACYISPTIIEPHVIINDKLYYIATSADHFEFDNESENQKNISTASDAVLAKKAISDLSKFLKEIKASCKARKNCKKSLLEQIKNSINETEIIALQRAFENLVHLQEKREALEAIKLSELQVEARFAEQVLSAAGLGNATLGKTVKSSTPPSPELIADTQVKEKQNFLKLGKLIAEAKKIQSCKSRLSNYDLQNVIREIMPCCSTSTCLYARVKGGGNVQICKSGNKAHYKGLQTCKNTWVCPHCEQRIKCQRRDEIQELAARHLATGGEIVMITKTVPHKNTDDLDATMSKLSIAESKFRSGKQYSKIRGRFGILGTVRIIEPPLGLNGWHIHIHEIYFIDAAHSKHFEDQRFKEEIYKKWSQSVIGAGFDKPSAANGVDLSRAKGYKAIEIIVKYITKFGIQNELTRQRTKKSKNSIAPFELLEIYALTKDNAVKYHARALFCEYAAAFKGRRQTVFSHGLRELYGINVLDDEEVIEKLESDEQIEDQEIILYEFQDFEWENIRHAGLRGVVLRIAEQVDGAEEFTKYISVCIEEAEKYRLAGNWRSIEPIINI